MRLRRGETDPGVGDLVLGAEQPLTHGRLGDQERRSDLAGAETRDRLQGQRHPTFQRQRWMAAAEQQHQAVVRNRAARTAQPRRVVQRTSFVRRTRRSVRPSPAPGPSFASSVRRRRSRSSARRWAVVVSQAPGLSGRPSMGQRASARSAASWTQSSARSQSPVTRISVATIRSRSAPTVAVRADLTAAGSTGISAPRTARTAAARADPRTPSGAPRRSRWPGRGCRTRGCRSRRSTPCSRRTGRR